MKRISVAAFAVAACLGLSWVTAFAQDGRDRQQHGSSQYQPDRTDHDYRGRDWRDPRSEPEQHVHTEREYVQPQSVEPSDQGEKSSPPNHAQPGYYGNVEGIGEAELATIVGGALGGAFAR